MIAWLFLFFLGLSGAADVGPSAPTSRGKGTSRPGESLISVSAEQATSPSEVIIRVTLLNASADRLVWINSRPRVGTGLLRIRDTEIELSIMDAHRRMVTDLCEALHALPDRSGFVALKPKQQVVVSFDLDPRCYSLIPGEKLLVQLTYGATKDWPSPASGVHMPLEPVGLNEWKKVVVPDGWKDTATPRAP